MKHEVSEVGDPWTTGIWINRKGQAGWEKCGIKILEILMRCKNRDTEDEK